MPKTRTPTTPAFLETARTFYAEAFDHQRKRDLQRSIDEWGELTEDEQAFSVAHLLYLNLQAQAAGHKLLVQVRDLLDEVAESLTTAIEESLPPEPGEEPAPEEEAPDDDGADSPAHTTLELPVRIAPPDGGEQ